MKSDVIKMALGSYGYGRWESPYWFIGPEQGQGRHEKNALSPRAGAWQRLGECELVDCREFHTQIGVNNWHREHPQLQQTWRRLILLLMVYLARPAVLF